MTQSEESHVVKLRDDLVEPTLILSPVEEYLSSNVFELYIANDYTRHLVQDKDNVLCMNKADAQELDEFLKTFKSAPGRLVAIGAGTVVDVVKYISFKTGSPFSFIPSALSTNSFATHRNSFFDPRHGKISFNSAVASEIIVDFVLLEQAHILNKFGLVEIASTATAQVDCTIAAERNSESFDAHLLERAQRLATNAAQLLSEPLSRSGLEKLLDYLLESGRLTRLQGNGRLVSGTEHIISSYIEGAVACPHGMGLLFGILIAQQLHSRAGHNSTTTNKIAELLMRDADMRQYIESTTSADQIKHTLAHVQPRTDKFTVLDILPEKENLALAEKAVESYFLNV